MLVRALAAAALCVTAAFAAPTYATTTLIV